MTGERCVLTFHRVVETPERDHDLSLRSFGDVLACVAETQVTSDLSLAAGGSATVLTFDDGTSDHAAVGERLAAAGLAGVFFVSAGRLDAPGYLGREELVELRSAGHVVGSHGYEHVRLDHLDGAALHRQVADSKARLEEATGAEIAYFAPPGGSRHRALADELVRNGYVASRTTRWGIHRSDAERFAIPCVPVTELTVARGWVAAALARRRLPWTMQAAYVAKGVLPARAHAAVRRRSHRSVTQ